MSCARFASIVCLLALVALSGVANAKTPQPLVRADVEGALVPVPAWDESSPQRLVLVDGQLYQDEGETLYPVIAGQITVRLADDVASWGDLVAEALATDAGTFAALSNLQPLRENRLRVIDLKVPEGTALPGIAELVFRTGLVRYAEVGTWGSYTLIPNDARFGEQWALNNTGQTGGSADADIDAVEAWDLTTGDSATIVAVIDSGTEVDHEDLAATVWINTAETPNNGIDDDGNGYVDDYEGWDFNNNNNDPRSTNFHGTHVMGIVCAATGNGIGIAGIAGGDGGGGARGMALGVGDSSPNGNVLDDAILYAADNGAAVITLSLSVGETQAINDALAYAYNERDVFIDCAAGNSGSSVSYPARRPEVMSVASTTHDDVKSGFSNPGPENEVAAPGSDILSTQLNDSYGTSSGTSFAAPQVAGVAALIRSRNAGLPAPDVRQLLIDSAEDVGPAGFDNGTGWGRINAFEAVSLAATSNGIVRLDADFYSCADEVKITVSDVDLAGLLTYDVTLTSDTESGGEVVTLTESGDSSGVFRGTVPTASGAPAADGVLQLSDGDTITVEYIDADDGEGGLNVSKTDTATADCRAPIVSDIEESNLSDTTATIAWKTDEASTSVVRYGAVAPPTDEESRTALVTDHSVPLNGLEECTVYKYEVESLDALGNAVTDDNGGQYYTFETYGNFPEIGVVPCHRGQAILDDDAYTCAASVVASVTDLDLNADPNVVETVEVLMTSTSEPEGEWITLTELDADSIRFEGTIDLDSGAPDADGLLQIAPGDLVSVSYYDEDDGEGNPLTNTDTARIDCVSPAIGDVVVTQLTNTRARVEWTTDEPATSRVDYGTSAALGSVAESGALTTNHSLVISGFDACGRVHFTVTSVDRHGDVRSLDADGVPFAFNMNEIGGLLFYDGFEGASNWDLDGEWEIGAPAGLGSYAGDPDEAYSGSGVLGSDLTGQGSFAGDYEPNETVTAVTPTLDATGARNLELIYKRKLGVRSGDSAGIDALTSGLTTVWRSSGSINDGGWVESRHDISGTDGEPSLRVVFRIESDGSTQSFGWNLDEVIIKDASAPDYQACGGCAGAPTFAGLGAVEDPNACAPGGLQLSWDAASAWGTGSGGTYDVHRGTTPDFVPDSSNRIASGVTDTFYTDAGAPVDSDVWYVVRARSNESCTGGEGLADANTLRLGGRETTVQPPPVSPGASLLVEKVGAAHARLTWDATLNTSHYVVRRSESADFSDAQDVGETEDTVFEDEDALTNAKLYLYKVFAQNACGDEVP